MLSNLEQITDIEHPYVIKICTLADQGKVTEEVISYNGDEDILLLNIDNPRFDKSFSTTQAVVANVLAKKRPEFGYSLTSNEPHSREYVWTMINNCKNQRPRSVTELESGRVVLHFQVVRYGEFVRQFAFNRRVSDDVKVSLYSQSLNCYAALELTPIVSEDGAVTVYDIGEFVDVFTNPRREHLLKIEVPSEQLSEWMEVEISTQLVVTNDEYRDNRMGVVYGEKKPLIAMKEQD